MIPFNIPPVTGDEEIYLKEVFKNGKFSGDGPFTKKCNRWFEENFNARKALLTTSCTHALEMSAILCEIKEGDEVIMPSYTFVSTANAFALRGARIIFIDIRPDTMNMDENLIEEAISEKTKAIVPVHYAGVACEMDKINQIAKEYNLFVIEDAAQGVMAKYKGKPLGTLGDIGCYSFHETKNYQCGEGGAIIVNNEKFVERSEIIREKGTNRSKFLRGQVDKYTWVDIGSSYLPSELNAAFLYAQLLHAEEINKNRLKSWNIYYRELEDLAKEGYFKLPFVPKECEHNAHMFYIKVKDIEQRSDLIDYLKKNGILSVFHYIPLHSSIAGLKFGKFMGEDKFTTKESERLLRLPLYFGMKEIDIFKVCDSVRAFFKGK